MRDFIESLLRVSDIRGTSVLMLALGYALGSTVEFVFGYIYFVRDFSISRAYMGRLMFQSFSASVLGGFVTYVILALTGAAGEVNTTIGLMLQGFAAGATGLVVTISILVLLKNGELHEAVAAFQRKFKGAAAVPVEATEVSS